MAKCLLRPGWESIQAEVWVTILGRVLNSKEFKSVDVCTAWWGFAGGVAVVSVLCFLTLCLVWLWMSLMAPHMNNSYKIIKLFWFDLIWFDLVFNNEKLENRAFTTLCTARCPIMPNDWKSITGKLINQEWLSRVRDYKGGKSFCLRKTRRRR
jgi:hypothetical protein